MTIFWKAAAMVILTVILGAAIGKKEADIAVVLSIASCCVIAIMAIQILSDVIGFLLEFSDSLEYQNPFTETLLKIAGVALVSELTGLISADAGNAALEKVMRFLGNAVILSLALPLFEKLFEIVQEILNIV